MTKAYYVVAFPQENPLAQHSEFHRWGAELLERSAKQAQQKITESEAAEFEYALVLSLPSIPEAVRDLLPPAQAKSLSEAGFPYRMPEYEGYERVYFLNELALKMYREGGIVFDVLEKITEDELPQGCDMIMLWPH